MRFLTAAFALLLSMSAGMAQALPASCKLADAHYTLSSDKSFTLTFPSTGRITEWASDIALELSHGTESHYWFLFDAGSARYINVISTKDVRSGDWSPPTDDPSTRPLGEMHFFAWYDKYKFLDSIPSGDTAAPGYIFLPDLPEVLAYRAAPRVSIQQGVFLLNHCKGA